ncbi:PREDICTED: uncharacterized protein LOC108377992 [Rhagoletis zephyria]|uniref:uncharacterized protein LOC108377992 n=1 Tax=Rhagoletis zephyria TaxID=28612 RepID=UPI0008116800|nr:PREDICTED: uncharacterized protein LOC108377992 [Rhagoletis zephyria]
MVRTSKNLTHKEWTLLIIFVIYWFIFFPIIWFVIQPRIFLVDKSATILYAVILVAIYAVLHCIIYICFKRYEQKRGKELERRIYSLPKGITPEDIRNKPLSLDASLYVPKKQRVSMRVEPPTVPNAAATATNGSENSYETDSRRGSNVTIPLYIKENDDGKVRFISSYELYYDGERFRDEV